MNTESPIKRFPADWHKRSLDGKRDWLIRDGQARDWREASSLLGRHGAIVKLRRKLKKFAGKGDVRDVDKLAELMAAEVKTVTIKPTCEGRCGRVMYSLTQNEDGRREQVKFLERSKATRHLVCVECEAEFLSRPAQQERAAA